MTGSPAGAAGPPDGDPRLVLLAKEPEGPRCPLTPRLELAYGGPLALGSLCVYANFVSSVDGVVALEPEQVDAGAVISGRSAADRFVMALLRACADAVLIGAGTLRSTPGHRWTPDDVYAPAAADFADLRAGLGLAARPRLVVVSARGNIAVDHPALQGGALVLTTDAGAALLRGRLPADAGLVSLGATEPSGAAILAALRSEGHGAILTEGGPNLVGHLLQAGVMDELFLTVSPMLAGRSARPWRPGLVDGVAFDAPGAPWMDLVSVRREGAHLFLRYRLAGGRAAAPER